MKIALLTTDNRHALRQYEKENPFLARPQRLCCRGVAQLPKAEAQAWEAGRRAPDLIRRHWLATVGATAVAQQFLSHLKKLFRGK
jgi:hypothetical protein